MIDKDRVINWAENARHNAHPSEFPDIEISMTPSDLLRFAALVAAHEREQCALVCDDLGARYWAKDDAIESLNCEECAAAIRARSAG